MSNICAFFDVQGFHLNGQFLPREIACLSEASTIHFAVNHGKRASDITPQDDWSISMVVNEIHGLPFQCNGQGLLPNQAFSLLATFYGSSTTQDKFLVGYVSSDAEGILRKLAIPRVRIVLTSDDTSPPCQLHPNQAKYQCALKNVVKMWREYPTSDA